ncbi:MULTISPECIES: extracellular solute-binding protein [unclassified Oceanispirochaeta]|uniref:extracellular solute-binding protein n=1 Tax=unclassified Oceanispirochaeta TaxID=2635722 RepID=UPI000E09CB84|nr:MULTISPECIES: extracellular solute-binding protein [unclassified Oceanispirochaeta]MBF9016555.1 extracellular solute-binding protein [Oceanispirochaeta sp. M2]NPD73017.1 extracellular solute-binding protein [Oceanispirochaeta sp. M1]RDG31362.1 extracellular solute-binding protein [Oceanispirochaeta sp. M1]
MKKLLWIITIVLTTAGFSFAAGDQEASAESPKIIMNTFDDLWPEYMEEALIAAGLGGTVEFSTVPQNQYETNLKIQIASGEVGDLICMDAPTIAYYADMGALESLDAYWNKDDFNDLVGSAKEAVSWNGNIWAAPLNESNCVLYYNKEMFEKAGVLAVEGVENAWTLDDFLDAAKKLTVKNEKGETEVYGIMPQMFSIDQKNEGMTYTQMLWTWWFGADIISPNGKTVDGYFNSPESKSALQFYADLFNKYEVAPSTSMVNFFAGEKVAMYINGPWMTGVWKNNYPEFNDKWGAMPLPRGAAAASNSGSWNIAVTAQSENKEAAFAVLQAITGKEGAAIYCNESGNLPARKSVLDKTDMSTPPFNVIQEQLMMTSKARPVTPNYPVISEAYMNAFNAVAYGQDVDSAFKEAVQIMNDSLADK